MPAPKKSGESKRKNGSKETMSTADIKRAQRMHKSLQKKLQEVKREFASSGGKELQLKLEEVKNELKLLMGHIPHCA